MASSNSSTEENAVSGNENSPVVDNNQGTQPPNAQGQAQQQARPGGWQMVKSLAMRMFIIYMISSFFRRGTPPPENNSTPGQPGSGAPPAAAGPSHNVYRKNLPLDMYVYLSEQEVFTDFANKKALFWLEEQLYYGDWTSGLTSDGSYYQTGQISLSENLLANKSSLYLHVIFVKSGASPNPKSDDYDKIYTVRRVHQLNRFKKRKLKSTVNLITGKTETHPDLVMKENSTDKVEILSMWHPNLTLNLIEDQTPWTKGSVPAPLSEFIEFVDKSPFYKPILFFNDYWNLHKHYMPINSTTPVVNLSLTYSPMTMFKWQLYAAQTMRNKWYSSMLGADVMPEDSDEDQDSLKETLVETNPYLLALTIVVSLVHSVFEFLAFKNDIQFWRNRKSLEGLSVRSVFFNVFQSTIIVLYVLDNETNFVVKVSVFIGLLIEIWKITKVTDVKLDRENKLFGVIPRPKMADKSTYTESSTRKYDVMAFRYLSWLMFPLLGAYAVYSLFYHEHKGWYSWVLSLMYGFLLLFGFIMMTPQLFINYKLKSVAHLPWRMLTYKALNTFIDDLFAFVIKMPILYRIGCFRDDVVFVIFLYQRYIYRIDPKRVNEYGVSQEMLEQNGNTASSKPGAITSGGEAAVEKSSQEKKED